MKVEIFPYVFGRVGGASINMLKSFESIDLNNVSQELIDLQIRLNQFKDDINVELYKKIEGSKSQNLLLNLKRDIYNDRNISQYFDHEAISKDAVLNEELEKYIRLKNKTETLEQKIDIIYNDEILNSIELLKKISNRSFIGNGLIFSSDSIYQNLARFRQKKNGLRKAREMRMALSILSYLTRSTAKTSPFSSFNSIFALEEKNNVFVPIKIVGNRSKLSINNLIFLIVKKILLSVAPIKKTFRVTTNPTIDESEKLINYFYNEDNNEAFCNVQKNDIISFIFNVLDKRECINYNDLADEIEKASEEEMEQVTAYLDQLIAKGIIIIHVPVHIKDKDWPQKLLAFLESLSIDDQHLGIIRCLIEIFNHLILKVTLIENNLIVSERRELCIQAYMHFSEQLELIKQKIDISKVDSIIKKLSPDNLFYEDTITDSVNEIDGSLITKSLSKIGYLHQVLEKNSLKNEIRKGIAKKIKEIYGDKKVPLMTFYRDVYLLKRDDSETIFKYQNNLFNIFKNFFQSLHYPLNAEGLDLENHFEHEQFDEVSTLDLFTQTGNINGKETLIINNILSGTTTNVSRFMHLYPAHNIDQIIKNRLSALYKNMIVSELVDASIHNTNTFPHLADFVIDVSLNNGDNKSVIDLNELYLCLDNKQDVIIENKQDNRVIPADFSMESIQRRSALMRFIDIFSNTNSEGITALLQTYENIIILNSQEGQEHVVEIPRLYYSDSIVLSRKKWLIKIVYLKRLFSEKKTDSINFVAFNEWRKKLNIPDHIFIKIDQLNNINSNRKPQYINLLSPILFKLFRNMIIKGSDVLEISEMLPAPQHLAKNEKGDSYVTEHIFNLSFTD